MKKDAYHTKLNAILQLPQFEKMTEGRKNALNPILKEENRIVKTLKEMRNNKQIDEELYKKLCPIGSQPPRLYGLAKVHKNNIPVRPVLSMPGSAYHPIAQQIAQWLETVPECKINSSTRMISNKLKCIHLAEDEELVSFDVSSLYTNVPVMESINVCADLLYRKNMKRPPVNKSTFIELAKIASCNVVMSTHDGYYRQTDGLAMGSPPAPHLANGWMAKFDTIIQGNAQLFTRYMDDILREIKCDQIDSKLTEINNLHPNLSFTIERENEGTLPFLDMQLIHEGSQVSSTWYAKPTDTGLILNFHGLAPKRYKHSVVSGFVHRIYRACSTWKLLHSSLQKAKATLERNQYPPSFYEPIVQKTLTSLIQTTQAPLTTAAASPSQPTNSAPIDPPPTEVSKRTVFVQYRGKVSEDYACSLHQCGAPCNIIFTLKKTQDHITITEARCREGS